MSYTFEPLKCSQCGSINAVKPLNQPAVMVRCQDCGHEKRDPAWEKPPQSVGWTSGGSGDTNTF